MKPILILGLGNLLQADDGVGCRVAEELMQGVIARHGFCAEAISASRIGDCFASLAMTRWRDDVEVMDGGTPGVGLINLFEGRQRVIIIDAAEMEREPGTVMRFRPEDVALTGSTQRFSLHRTGVADALSLARTLGIALPEIVVFGVQPARVEWGEALSPTVEAAMPQLIQAVLKEVGVHHGK